MRIVVLMMTCWYITAPMAFSQSKGKLTISINNIEKTAGSLYVALYNVAETFLDEGVNPYGKIIPVTKSSSLTVAFDDLPFGDYAIAVYHDLNDNGKLDKNVLGIPTEPYAFSNNPAVKWRSPSFAEARIAVKESQKNISVKLKRWKKY